jgi:hypothetical protein
MALPNYITPHFMSSGNVGLPGDEDINNFLVSTDGFTLQSSDGIFLIHI